MLLATLVLGAAAEARPLPSPEHVVVIVFENKDASEVTARTAPAFTALATRYARLANYHAVAHPSLPNYLALVSGSTHGITSDCTTCTVSGDTIGDQLTAAGRTWNAFAEDYPHGARFAKKHVPFMYFARDRSRVLPLSRFDPTTLPAFAFVTPNLCHDMHDCSIAVGDAWLERFVRPLVKLPHAAVFVVFDEGALTNHVPALVLGTAVRRGAVFEGSVDHYGLLRTIEELEGLPVLGKAASAPTITGIWR